MDIHIHIPPDPDVCRLEARVKVLEERLDAMHDEFESEMKRVDAATSAIKARLDALAAELEGGITAEQAVPLMAHLKAIGDTLEPMGKDPANLVPVPVPEPLPT